MKLHHMLVYAILCIVCISAVRNYKTLWQNMSFVKQTKQALEIEKTQNKELKRQLLQSQDLFMQESYTRDVLGLQKEGETVLQIPTQ